MKHVRIEPDFTATKSWATRFELYRGSRHERACLDSIHTEARESGDDAFLWATQAAIDNLDTGTRDFTELEDVITSADEAEREASRAYRFECRTGREWEDRHVVRGGWGGVA